MFKYVLVLWVHLSILSLGYEIDQIDYINEEDEYIVDLVMELELYLAFARFGSNSNYFAIYNGENKFENKCEEISLLSDQNIVYAQLEDRQTGPISISKCENFDKLVEIVSVNVENYLFLSKEEFVQGVISYLSKEIGRKVSLGTKVVINEDRSNFGYSLNDPFRKGHGDIFRDFHAYAKTSGMLNAVNLFYLDTDSSLFWDMVEIIGNYSDQELVSQGELHLYSTAMENLRNLYKSELWANDYIGKKIICNEGCAICKDSPNSCSLCEQGYYLDNSTCIKCPDLCKACKSKNLCLSCIQNPMFRDPLKGCSCKSLFINNSPSNHCESCQDPNCLNCGENSKSCQKCKQGYLLSQNSCQHSLLSSRSLTRQDEIEEYKQKCKVKGVINAIKETIKSHKLKNSMCRLIFKDLDQYVSTQIPDKYLLEDVISIIDQFLNNSPKAAYKTENIKIFTHTITNALASIEEISSEHGTKIFEIAEKIIKSKLTHSNTEYVVAIIESLLNLYNEVATVTHFRTDHLEVLKTTNKEEILLREKFLEGKLKFKLSPQNLGREILITITLIVIQLDDIEFYFNAYSNKNYVNSTIIETNKTELVLKIPAKLIFRDRNLFELKCEEISKNGKATSCTISKDMKNKYFYEVKQCGLYRISITQWYFYWLEIWLLFYPLFIISSYIIKRKNSLDITKDTITDFDDKLSRKLEATPRNIQTQRKFHLCLGLFSESSIFSTIDRISIYISTLNLQLCIQIVLGSEYSLPITILGIISVVSSLPFTLLHTYFLMLSKRQLLIEVSIFTSITMLNLIVFFFFTPKDPLTCVMLLIAYDFILCQTVLFFFIRRLNS